MQQQNLSAKFFNRLVLISGIVVFTYFLFLSQLFFKERTCFVDMSFILFNICKDHTLQIQVNRFGSAVTQIFPLVATWLHFSLENIARIYSASFVIWYFLVFLICALVFKKYSHALLMLLFATLMVADTFYWLTNELLQGVAFSILFFAFVDWAEERNINRLLFYSAIVFSTCTAAFFHPLVMVAFIFFCTYKWLNERKKIWIIIAACFSVFYLIKLEFFPADHYDAGAFSNLANVLPNAGNCFKVTTSKNFAEYLLLHYQFWLISLIIVSVFHLKTKKRFHLILLLLFTVGSLFIINTAYADCNLKFYLESFYLLLGFFVSVPLCFEILPEVKSSKILIAVISVGLIIRCSDITLDHKKFTARLNWMENFLAKTNSFPNRKLIINDSQIPIDTLIITWGSAYEGWLISSMKKPFETRSIIIDYDLERHIQVMNHNKIFIGMFKNFQCSKLDTNYFHFQDTSHYVLFDEKMFVGN
ncbi:MAG: hypothetical protein WCI97_02950 [Bacteroidota bacterium]